MAEETEKSKTRITPAHPLKKRGVKLVLLGESGVGKSSIAHRLGDIS